MSSEPHGTQLNKSTTMHDPCEIRPWQWRLFVWSSRTWTRRCRTRSSRRPKSAVFFGAVSIAHAASRIIEELGKTAKEKDVAAALRPFLDQQFGKVRVGELRAAGDSPASAGVARDCGGQLWLVGDQSGNAILVFLHWQHRLLVLPDQMNAFLRNALIRPRRPSSACPKS